MYIITGATGQLGQKVLNNLIKEGVNPNEITALARTPDKLKTFIDLGVKVAQADYNDLNSLKAAFSEGAKLLLISSSEVGARAAQHKNVIAAAVAAKVSFITYTSILRADESPLALAHEHRETEALIKASGLHYNILRNGWYTENYTANVGQALEFKTLFGCAANAKLATASREDYALAAVKNLINPASSGTIYELAGDEAFTLQEYADTISQATGQSIKYQNLSEKEFEALLVKAGLPSGFAYILAETETQAQEGWLDDRSHSLSKLIGRKTTPLRESVKAQL